MPVFVMLIFTVTTGLCPNFYSYLASQFMVGIGYGGFRLNGVILGTVYAIILRSTRVFLLSVEFSFQLLEYADSSKPFCHCC